jgi:peptidoglycan hydrolase-like protein with peptidoglycan-binding domain
MRDQLLVLTAGFLLTGVLGGSLGYVFQRRAWAHQHRVERAEQQHRLAMTTFEEVSSLLDKRLYRMRRVFWAARRRCEGGGQHGVDSGDLQAALDDYRQVLAVWNDNLNRLLALVATYIGHGVRDDLGREIYEQFAAVGWALDEFVRQVSTQQVSANSQVPAKLEGVPVPPLARRLNDLSDQIFNLNSLMLTTVNLPPSTKQARTTWRWLRDVTLPRVRPPELVEFGRRGYQVERLQRALRRAGHPPGTIDGAFGTATEHALRAFQRSHHLDPDGIAGPRTWAALPTGHQMRRLSEGDTGAVVLRLQEVLTEYAENRWHTVPGRTDGVFDAGTTAAVTAFQRWRNLRADGIVGEDTWAAELDAPEHTLEERVGLDFAGGAGAMPVAWLRHTRSATRSAPA